MARKSNSKRTIGIILGLIVGLMALLYVAKKMEWIGKEKPKEVELAKVKMVDIVEKVTASGKIQPEVEVKISPDVSGEIIGLYIEEGDTVKKGQLLLKIRPDNYESMVEQMNATLNASKAQYEQSKSNIAQLEARLLKSQTDYNRNKRLHDEKVISDSNFDEFVAALAIAKQDLEASKSSAEAARFNVKSTEANLKEANQNLNRTSIFAPMNGVISKLGVELGERVVGTSQMAGTELLRIANLSNMETRVNVNENDIVRVHVGDSVDVDVDAYTAEGKKFKGIVYEVASSANGLGAGLGASTDAVTEFEVKIRVLPSSYSDLLAKSPKNIPLKPGMTASVEIITNSKRGILSVPISSVSARNPKVAVGETDNKEEDKDEKNTAKATVTKSFVFVNNKGKAAVKYVTTGISDYENIEIINGLSKGEEIISGPYIEVSKKLKIDDLVAKKEEKKK